MKLRDWLLKEDKSAESFGRDVDKRGLTIRRWCSGERRAEPEMIELVKDHTNGEVTEVDHHETRLEFIRKKASGIPFQ